MREKLIQLAKESQIPFPGIGTDGVAMSLANKGILTAVLFIPSRYAHDDQSSIPFIV